MADKSLGGLGPVASASDADHLMGSQGGNSRRFTVGQVRAGLAPTAHTHAIADVTNLQTTLDGKAPTAHTHTEADITGTIAPAKLAQAGATTGQVLKWNGTAYAPANDDTGASAGYASQRTVTASGNITDADRNGVVYINGAGITATFVRTNFVARDRVLLINIGTASAIISAGTDGFNTAGTDTFTLFPGEEREVVYEGTADPFWRVAVPSTIQLAANQVAVLNDAGVGFEARTQDVFAASLRRLTGNVAFGAAASHHLLWSSFPARAVGVRARTVVGTCTIELRLNGGAPFLTATNLTTTASLTAVSQALAPGDLVEIAVTNAVGLDGLHVAIEAVRTAE